MPIIPRLSSFFNKGRESNDVSEPEDHPSPPEDGREKGLAEEQNKDIYSSDGESISSGQDGVKKAQATTIVWTRKSLVIAYALIFLIFFVNSLGQQISNNVLRFVTSDFNRHPLTATTSIVSSLVAGVIKLPIAKIMDIFGRIYGFGLMVFCAVVGLIMMAACNSVTTYAAAQVFYWVGMNGIAYVLDVFIADTSSLKWRGLMLAFSTSPYIATTFAGPAAAARYMEGAGWRWVYGTFAIVTPAMCAPFLWVFWRNQQLARKQGILVDRREASGRTWYQSLKYYFIEFDFFGMILIIAGWSLLLLPFSLASSSANEWQSASIIAMLVIGFCLLVIFVIWERFFATKSFLPFKLLTDRTVIGSCLTAGTLFISFYCWDVYFSSYMQVVFDLSIADAGYVYNIYSIGSCFWSIVVGLLIPASGRFKWLALCAIPLMILGTGLMIHFRQPHHSIGYVIMCQIFIAFAGGTIVICQQVAIMAAVGPENIAVALALQSLFTAIGGSIGQAISGGIWTNTLLAQLERHLPSGLKDQASDIYLDINVPLGYAWGSPGREGTIEAYAATQRYMCIAATAVLALMIVWVMMWRNYSVHDFKKPRGAKII
ncbi:uncharacterized protein LTR77_002605 [Saxophila tyrrhenica]|uniref:Major facilitator superfamily (MFS) profile domain-containing protein n=1 Tax=Saxophila tyrrhenica TaxID=1690608 RepID=A0AAV9PJ42_9PEZI|nr:hypothetical protein LTR77_002605 [Saxophila tyrrhenica]